MTAEPLISTDSIARWWDQAPDQRGASSSGRIEAAIWSGGPREIWAEPDETTNIVAMPLTTYTCCPRADARAIAHDVWRRGEFQTMVAGVSPYARLATDWRMLHVYVRSTTLRSVAEDHGIHRTPELIDPEGDRDPALQQIFQFLELELSQHRRPSALLVDSLGVQLSIRLMRGWSNVRQEQALVQNLNARQTVDWRLRRVIEYLEAHLMEDVGLAELAAIADLSQSHFATVFRAGIGETPHRWLNRRRIERACEMLADPHLAVTDIALACGFSSSQHFATAFRKQIGVTPSAFRLEHTP